MDKLIIATHNPNKLKEIKQFLQARFKVLSLAEVNYHAEIEETGSTFVENCLLKLHALAKVFPDYYILADDSGLCIDKLAGRPGVYSARFAGESTPYPEKFKEIWHLLQAFPKNEWTAYFNCTLALYSPNDGEIILNGRCDGIIIDEARGENGFGYDPIFYLPEFGKTMAMLTPEEKNSISHRGRALRQLAKILINEKKS